MSQNGVPNVYVKCICTELENNSKNDIISTIYIGGGTPSLLSVEQLAQIIQGVKLNFTVSEDVEFTLEVNPETFGQEKFLGFRELGVNRVSLGIQSFRTKYLIYLGRVHSAERAKTALQGLKEIFANVSVDLLSNLPGQTLDEARDDLLTAAGYSPEHISCYELTYEKGTALAGEKKNELDAEMYKQTKTILEQNGYRQYEISNYARPGFESEHNLTYWSDGSYLGVGVSAHSYDAEKKIRRANTGDLAKYLSGDCGTETTPEDSFNKIMMGLRKNSGIPLAYLDDRQKIKAGELAKKDLLTITTGHCGLTDAGRLVLNKILLELM